MPEERNGGTTETLDGQRGHSLDEILKSLTETIQWCLPRIRSEDPRGCLRSNESVPNALTGSPKEAVRLVVIHRRMFLPSKRRRRATGLARGQLLVYLPDINLSWAMEEQESKGYLDRHAAPPWDTWVAWVVEPNQQYLLSWVPREFIELVNAGMEVCIDDCLLWLHEAEGFELPRVLREKGVG